MNFKETESTLFIYMQDKNKSANALTLADSRLLKKHLKKPWKLIICVGTERVFCSGGPLKEYARLKTKSQGLKINREMAKNLQALEKHQAFKMAFVGGDCFGGGIEFLGCFDLIYSAPSAFYSFWQNRIGVSYGWGGYARLKSKLSDSFLKLALLEEKTLTAFEMKAAGLIYQILPADQFDRTISQWQKLFLSKKSKVEIQKNLQKNSQQVFEKLWWTEEHLQSLQKFAK
ncbi:enoyl-CoA hydratase/isomerase family protein [bacterium]|nr:enoyl-CoA hydratase/isomerase family protein [bacterium]